MPTWLAPEKKTRSPGCSWPIDTGVPIPNCAYELCGSEMPTFANAYITRPEQSKPRGDAPAQTYGTPRYCMATPTTPPWTFGGATLEPSGVDADAPTAMPDVEGGDPFDRRTCAAAWSCRCCAASAAFIRAISPRIDDRS